MARTYHDARDDATDPVEVKGIEDKLDAAERYMRNTGMYPFGEIFEVNITKCYARWKLVLVSAEVKERRWARTREKGGRAPTF